MNAADHLLTRSRGESRIPPPAVGAARRARAAFGAGGLAARVLVSKGLDPQAIG